MGIFLLGLLDKEVPVAFHVKLLFGDAAVHNELRAIKPMSYMPELPPRMSLMSFNDDGWFKLFVAFSRAIEYVPRMYPGMFRQPLTYEEARDLLLRWLSMARAYFGGSGLTIPALRADAGENMDTSESGEEEDVEFNDEENNTMYEV
jgi:hypothetical protein